MKTTTQEWLNFAKADIMNCEKILDEEFLTNIIAFHSQQAIEKSFKAIIEEKGLIIPRVHSLQRLHSIVEEYLPPFIDLEELDALDEIYTSSRYPGDIGMIITGKPTKQQATEFYETSKKINQTLIKTIEKK